MSDKSWQAPQHQDPADLESQLAGVEDAGSEGHAPNGSSRAQAPVDRGPEADQGRAAAARLAEAAQQGLLIPNVFISHTGPSQHAAGSTFAASILKPALEAAGLNVFMDFSSLELGCDWPKELVRCAANSAVVVVVLTKEYTQRYWCMLELSLAMHSRSLAAKQQQQQEGQQLLQQPLVIPVFYDDPGQVVHSDGILNHWQGPGLRQVPADRQDWVDPSGWAANICAMEKKLQAIRHNTLKTVKDRDYQLARHVVAAAVKAMPVRLRLDKVFGLDQLEADLTAELAVPDPSRLGLWLHGMGGSGKTTLAELLFNRLAPRFQYSAFIQLQHDSSSEHVGNLQPVIRLLQRLGAAGFMEASSEKELLTTLDNYVRDKPVLIVADNVSDGGQLDGLLPRSFKQGSHLIITSRSSDLTDSQWWRQANRCLVQHPVVGLTDEAAVQLLYCSANMDPHYQPGSGEMRGIVNELIDACKGLPLALVLAGAFLYIYDSNHPQPVAKWKEALAALQLGRFANDSKDRLGGILNSTFTNLKPAQQHMFLDAATALRGQPKELALAVWVGWHGPDASSLFRDLEHRNLVSCDSRGQLQMHDVLEAVCRRMLLDQSSALPQTLRGTRVWVQDRQVKGYCEGIPVLSAQLGTGAPHLDWCLTPEIRALQISDLSRARILLLGCTGLPTVANRAIALNDLLWLSSTIPVELGPQHFGVQIFNPANHLHNTQSLRILRLGSKVTARETETMLSKVAQLMATLFPTKLPNSLCLLTALQDLQLIGYTQLASLPPNFWHLKSLTKLVINSNKRLAALPESFGQLSALQRLQLIDCTQLAALPESSVQLKALTALYLSWCPKLAALPEAIGQLTALQKLYLYGCEQLASLPASFTQLTALRHLDINWCKKLEQFLDTGDLLMAMPHLKAPSALEHPVELSKSVESLAQEQQSDWQ